MITGVGREAVTCLDETASIVNAIQRDGKQKSFFASPCFTVSAKWREEEENLTLLFPKYRQSILLPMQAVFSRR